MVSPLGNICLQIFAMQIISHVAELLELFTALLHGMQMQSSDENSLRPSICLSNAWIVRKRKKNQSRYFYYTKDHLA